MNPKGRQRMTLASGLDPLVVWIAMFSEGEGIFLEDLAYRAGINPHTLNRWRVGFAGPTLANARAVVNALGYELVLRPIKKGGGQ